MMSDINVVARIEWGGIDMRKRIYGTDGIAPTLDTCQGGKKQVKILESGEDMIKAFAMRGRYNEDGTISQRIEFRKDDTTSTLTGVQKDNMILECEPVGSVKNITLNDLFCGAGGMGLGFKSAGIEIIGAYDFDKFAVQSYKHNVGDHVEQISINDMTYASMPKSNVWTFGFPCQDLSVSGKRAGMYEGKRSKLFFEVMRLLDETKEHDPDKLPEIIMAENVKGLKPYLEVLREEYLKAGYHMEYVMYNSKYWGVPQNRERYFVIGIRMDIFNQSADKGIYFEFPIQQEMYVPKLSSALESSVDEKYYIDSEKFELILKNSKTDQNVMTEGSRVRKLTPREYANLQGFPQDFEIVVSDSQAYKQFGNAVSVPVAKAIAERIKLFLLSI